MNNPGMFDAAWQEMLNNANMRVSTGADASVNTDYVKVPIFHDFVDDFPRLPYKNSKHLSLQKSFKNESNVPTSV